MARCPLARKEILLPPGSEMSGWTNGRAGWRVDEDVYEGAGVGVGGDGRGGARGGGRGGGCVNQVCVGENCTPAIGTDLCRGTHSATDPFD